MTTDEWLFLVLVIAAFSAFTFTLSTMSWLDRR
jgi:hypothetical protein